MGQNKKAQEEMVGLVVIMLVVAIIFLVLLGIFLRKGPTERADSAEVAQFLDALEEQTTECSLDGFTYANVRSLISACKISKKCENEKMACEVLKETLKEKTEAAWNFDENSPTKGYFYELFYQVGENPPQDLTDNLPFDGPCGTMRRGADKTFSSQGANLTIALEICLD